MPLLRTILRRTFYAAAAVSALLLLATLIAWPVSYYRDCYLAYMAASRSEPTLSDEYGIQCDSGRAVFYYETWRLINHGFHLWTSDPGLNQWSYLTWNAAPVARIPKVTTLGISWQYDYDAHTTLAFLFVPLSYLTLLFSILPLLAFLSIRRRRKAAKAAGLCPKCGYDLRAHQPGDMCPECGTPVAAKAESKKPKAET